MRRSVAIMCAVTAAAFTAISEHEIRIMASSPAVKSTNDDVAVFQNSNFKSTEEAFTPRFDGMRFIETLVTAHR